jgi:hypothetical protein
MKKVITVNVNSNAANVPIKRNKRVKISQIVNDIVTFKLVEKEVRFSEVEFDLDHWWEDIFLGLSKLGYEVDVIPTHIYNKGILKIEVKYLKHHDKKNDEIDEAIDYEYGIDSYF